MIGLARALIRIVLVLTLVACGTEATDAGGGPPGDDVDPIAPPTAPPSLTVRVSVHSDGTLPNGRSGQADISHDGRFVAFASLASNLVDGDTNDASDVFVHDRATHTTQRVSLTSAAEEATGASFDPALSADGRVVAFASEATNLLPDGALGPQVFVHDRSVGITTLVSITPDGTPADGASRGPALSADGRTIAFVSEASNLVEGRSGGLFLHDRDTGDTTWLDEGARPSISGDGRYVAFEARGTAEIRVLDRATGITRPIVDGSGREPDADSDWPSLDDAGRHVAFHSLAGNLVPERTPGWGVFVHDLASGATELVSVNSDGETADDFSFSPAISASGRHVAFSSLARNLAPPGSHVGWSLFVHDRVESATRRIPVSSGPQNLFHFSQAISADGRHVAFVSVATVIIDGVEAGVEGLDGEPNGVEEVFVHSVADGASPSPAAPASARP